MNLEKLQKEFERLEEELEVATSKLDSLNENNYIKNVDNFILRLRIEKLYTPKLEKFINDYMRYNND